MVYTKFFLQCIFSVVWSLTEQYTDMSYRKQFAKPSHSTFLGSGSHFQFSMHIEVLGPMNVSPEEQFNMIVVLSNAGCSYPDTLTELPMLRE